MSAYVTWLMDARLLLAVDQRYLLPCQRRLLILPAAKMPPHAATHAYLFRSERGGALPRHAVAGTHYASMPPMSGALSAMIRRCCRRLRCLRHTS